MKAILCVGLFAVSGPLVAQSETIPWKEVAGWTVRMGPSMGNACYVTTSYEDGTVLRLGFEFSDSDRLLYFSLGNTKWKSLEDGKEYPVRIQFDSETPWNAKASAIKVDSFTHLKVNTRNADFVSEFSKKLGLRAFYAEKQIVSLRLGGSSKAIDEMLSCQQATDKLANAQKPAPKDEDPFTLRPL
ncbi:MAG: hypothetical protein PGN22_10285 [Agrobacterium cavarae]